ncbi:hypothetical protein H9Q69_008512 [Fusarium xylarioides]|uniref:Ricin B lectin domain-containing protein n=1 Tax=Fusarium xylarioides TaxID=221167 RepID=A0A9P7L5G5_9HYPO|nr:hypothetical protein H9Q72_007559 [Fusarium xylarioides]KAG5792436.1 hypothetical protein H9Q69_008512 [Fusarium xylarioides]
MSKPANLKPATDIDSNVWYQLTELAVDDYDGKLKTMLQPTSPGGDLRVWPANKNSYWQFQKIGTKPGRYALRCSMTTTEKQLSICYRSDEINESKRTRPCLMPSDDSEMQQWDISSWGSDGTYRLTNVKNGTGWNLDCIPSGAVFMSDDFEGDQPRQRWLMSSVGDVDNKAYSTTLTAPPESTVEKPIITAATTGSEERAAPEATSDSSSGDSSSSSSSLSSGAVAGISIGATIGVAALALLAFFLWRRNKRKSQVAGSSGSPKSPDKYSNSPMGVSPAPAYSSTHSAEKNYTTSPVPAEMLHDQRPVELQAGTHHRHELP